MQSDQINTISPTWRAVKAWAMDRIEQQLVQLETIGRPHEETEQIRGAIRELRLLVRLPEPSKIMTAESMQSID